MAGKKSKFTATQIAKMQSMRSEGETLQAIADLYGCNRSTVAAHTTTRTNQPQTPRQQRHRRTTEKDRLEMRRLRKEGLLVETIAGKFNVSLSVVYRWTNDIELPTKPKLRKPLSARNITKLDREQRRKTDAKDRQRQASQPLPVAATFAAGEHTYPTVFEHREYDTTDPLPDPYLAAHAEAILTQAVEGAAKGRIWERRPVAFTQATLIYLAGIPMWDYDSFLANRSMWRAVRDMASINSTTIADRLEISPASISRYEKGTRNPPKALMQDLHTAYVELYEQALEAAELMLAIDSYVDTFGSARNVPVHDQPFNLDGFDTWIDQGVPLADHTLDHVEALHNVRSWLPYPTWREPTPGNLWLRGYPNQPAVIPA